VLGGIPATDRFPLPFATLDPDPTGKITRQTGDIMVCQQGFQKEMLDMRLTHPVNVDVRNGNFVEKGEANKKASQEKIRKHGEKCARVGVKFQPLCIDTFGSWGDSTIQWFDGVISAAADTKKISFRTVKTYWIRRVGIAVQRGVAQAMIARLVKAKAGQRFQRDEAADDSVVLNQGQSSGSAGAMGFTYG
jgi:hypothetical protein